MRWLDFFSIAYAAQGGVSLQRGLLSETGRKMALVSERFPVVNQIMMKVRVRRVRDTLILAALVGVLLVIVWLNIRK